jgi:hypothetical protein
VLTREAVRAHLSRCFATTYGALAEGTSVASTLTLELTDDGAIRAARFDPPLRRDFLDCAWISGRFAGERGALRLPVHFGP